MTPADPQLYRQILDELEDGVYFVDLDRRITYWSEGAARITGYDASAVVGRRCMDNILNHVDGRGQCLCHGQCPLAATMVDGDRRSTNVYLHHKQGHRVPVKVRTVALRDGSGKVIGGIETFADRSSRVAEIERLKHLENLAYLDPLTGIANRRFIEATLSARFTEFQRYGWPFGLIMADVDHFKSINDQFGHDWGDRVLKIVAETLSRNARPFDLVGRWGGEEFVVVAANLTQDYLAQLAERLRALVCNSDFTVDGQRHRVTVSIGASLANPGDDPASLLRRVDTRLYQAKLHGRNRVWIV